jgi:hypothetical protein
MHDCNSQPSYNDHSSSRPESLELEFGDLGLGIYMVFLALFPGLPLHTKIYFFLHMRGMPGGNEAMAMQFSFVLQHSDADIQQQLCVDVISYYKHYIGQSLIQHAKIILSLSTSADCMSLNMHGRRV